MKKLLFSLVLVSGLFGSNIELCEKANKSYWSSYNRLVSAVSIGDGYEARSSYIKMKNAYYDTQEYCSDRVKKLFTESFLLINEVMHAK